MRLKANASLFIITHNHPSRNLKPSNKVDIAVRFVPFISE
ncbi:JAB domain-containing protein [Nitritalea halalkaliphila]